MSELKDSDVRRVCETMGVSEAWVRYAAQSDTFRLDHPMFAKSWVDVPYGRAFPKGE